MKKVEDKQYAVTLYNLFQKYITEIGDIEVISLSEFDDDVEEDTPDEEETLDLEEFLGFEYYEDTDVQIVKDISNFILE